MTHKPFKDLTDAEKGALLLAHHRGEWIEHKAWRDPSLEDIWYRDMTPQWRAGLIYRIAPEPKTPDTIDWSHVSDDIVAMTRDEGDRYSKFYCAIPIAGKSYWMGEEVGSSGRFFTSYHRGTCDWKDSLVIRPGYEDKS